MVDELQLRVGGAALGDRRQAFDQVGPLQRLDDRRHPLRTLRMPGNIVGLVYFIAV
jgi:hypothetical protein